MTTSTEQYILMVASDNIVEKKQYVCFQNILTTQKNLSPRLFIPFLKNQVMKITLNNLLQALWNLVVRRVTKEGEFYNKYLG